MGISVEATGRANFDSDGLFIPLKKAASARRRISGESSTRGAGSSSAAPTVPN
jgi:hypothetical protein